MKSRPTFLGVFIVVLVIVAIVHMFIQLAFYGTGYKGFAEKGITGLAVEGSQSDGGFPISEVILFLEWGLIFLGMVFVYAKHKIDLKKELVYLNLLKDKKHFHGGTELDNFYELLKEMKHFRLSNAAKVFNVDADVIEDWAQSLETARVAELTYPRIGGPEIHFIEGVSPRLGSGDEEEESAESDSVEVKETKPVEKEAPKNSS
ncbi:MAG: hypothetical protein KKD18_02985 [Nanoarchaeota archaeon]|nr:hypothetical protein [Nanoarchaeota archaeon]MBU0977355.1 hypothetical protein [Nanoarchaeota archaeon]